MDAVLQSALGAVPQLGGAAILGWLLILLLRREGTALERSERLHAADRKALLEENQRLRDLLLVAEKRADDADARADLEMEARRQAQDALGGRHRETP